MARKNKISILVDAGKCTACQVCEMACSMAHRGTLSPLRSKIRVLGFEGVRGNVPLVCQACAGAARSHLIK